MSRDTSSVSERAREQLLSPRDRHFTSAAEEGSDHEIETMLILLMINDSLVSYMKSLRGSIAQCIRLTFVKTFN